MRLTTCAVIVGLALILSACGSAPAGQTGGADCAKVAAEVADTITEGANGTPITPTGKLGAVKSPEMKDAYIVAMEFTVGGGSDPEVGVWSLPNVDGSGPVFAVDAFAAQFTDWPNEIDGHEFSVTEPGVDDAKACLS